MLTSFYRESIGYTDCPECWFVIANRKWSVAYGKQNKMLTCFYRESIGYTDCPECCFVIANRKWSVAYGKHFGNALERDSACIPVDTKKQMDILFEGARQHNVSAACTLFLLLRRM
jgi:hypothetical protein